MKKESHTHKIKAILTGIFILTAYGMLVNIFTNSKLLVLVSDLISGISVIGIATILFSYFKPVKRFLSIAYLTLKLVEGSLMIAGGIVFIFNQGFREWIYESIHLYTFIISGFLLYILFYKSQIIPKFISIWGIMAIGFLFLSTVLKIFGISSQILDAFLILIITNEIFLAIWLMLKGFNLKKLKI